MRSRASREETRLRERLAEVESELAERKLIDRAKGVLMDKRQMSEALAYETMRNQAMEQGMKIAEVARQIIAMADLLGKKAQNEQFLPTPPQPAISRRRNAATCVSVSCRSPIAHPWSPQR